VAVGLRWQRRRPCGRVRSFDPILYNSITAQEGGNVARSCVVLLNLLKAYCAVCHSTLPFLSSFSFAHFSPHFPIAPLSLFALLNRFCTYALFLLSPLPILGSPQSLWFCSPPSHSFHHRKRLTVTIVTHFFFYFSLLFVTPHFLVLFHFTLTSLELFTLKTLSVPHSPFHTICSTLTVPLSLPRTLHTQPLPSLINIFSLFALRFPFFSPARSLAVTAWLFTRASPTLSPLEGRMVRCGSQPTRSLQSSQQGSLSHRRLRQRHATPTRTTRAS
jgi:hypothetical protein